MPPFDAPVDTRHPVKIAGVEESLTPAVRVIAVPVPAFVDVPDQDLEEALLLVAALRQTGLPQREVRRRLHGWQPRDGEG